MELAGTKALITGASGGIGAAIARTLARAGVDLAVSGRREDALAALTTELSPLGVRCVAVTAELADRDALSSLLERAEDAIGPLEVIVNNAGVEHVGSYATTDPQELESTIEINLVAPMLLTRLALPRMLERRRGHIVFVSSLAGKFGPAYNAPYAASKAGLVALTQSLRAEHAGGPVGFSVVCPGFTAGEGMYQRMVEEGHRSNRLLGETSTSRVAEAVLRAIRDDVGEIVESGAPIRPLLALQQVAPGMVERVAPRFGATRLFGSVAADRGRR
ncbi:MAG: SDR family NAD(P)-dependent oxidoreductase [Solirubrobacteraceae bacterium]